MPFLSVPLAAGGALIDVFVALSTHRVDVLKAAGMGYPRPEMAKAMIDTGAGISSISPRIAGNLGLVPSGITPIHSATSGGSPQNCNLYDVCLAFTQPSIKVLGVNVPVFELDLSVSIPGVDVLLGRDLLRQCLFIYDGQSSTFVLAF
jgi:hypothetical protein